MRQAPGFKCVLEGSALALTNVALFSILLKFSLCVDTATSRTANLVLTSSKTQTQLLLRPEFVTTAIPIRSFLRDDLVRAINALSSSSTVLVLPSESEHRYLCALYAMTARIWCVNDGVDLETDESGVLESIFFSIICANSGSRWIAGAFNPLERGDEGNSSHESDYTTPVGEEIREQLVKMCDRREIQQKLVVLRETLVCRLSCSVFSAPYTREAFERHRPGLSNQFDMCVYASVALQAQHDEFKRFAWPAIEVSTVMAVCQVLGQDALEYAKAVISFEDVGQAISPVIRRCGDWWFFGRLRYKCEEQLL